nr:zinc ribbon domain-containing protein [Candidatus Sigynarchaeum springense]
MANKPLDTEALFTKKKPMAIVVLVFAVVNIVVFEIMIGIHHFTPSPLFYSNKVPPIVYAVCLLVLTIIGKNKGKENRIMAFVFGIITLGLSAALVIDRLIIIGDTIETIRHVADMRIASIASLAFIVLIIVFSILSIVNSINIINENVPSRSAASRPAASGAYPQPAMSTPPPASTGARAQFCSSCGAALDAGAVFCSKCGAKV